MLIKTSPINRRTVLRGMLNGGAVAVSVPFLDMFLNENGTALAATGQPLPLRFGTWFWGLGVDPIPFTPAMDGKITQMPPQLAALEKVKQYINVFSNYDVLMDGAPNLCHFSGWMALRAGSPPSGRGHYPGPSLDQAIIDVIGGGTRFQSIDLTASGSPRDSYSFKSSDAISPSEVSPLEFYRKIFGPDFVDPNAPTFTPSPKLMVRKSVLSGVAEGRKDLDKILGAADKARMDQYYSSIRDVENRLALQLEKPPAAPNCKVPASPAALTPGLRGVDQAGEIHRQMTDLLMMALVCNQSKVFNMTYSNSGSGYSKQGWSKGHHASTHEEPMDPRLGWQIHSFEFVNYAMKEWGYFVEKMAATQEGDGSLLDRSLVYAHSDCQIAKFHSLTNVPMMTAGTLGGKVKAGQHIRGKAQAASQLGLTIQQLMGVPIGNWGTKSMNTNRTISEMVATSA